jgi:hypothetical protein
MKRKTFFFTFIVLILISCSTSIKVQTDYTEGTNYEKYKTYKIVEVEADKTGINEITLTRVINAVKREMESKGFSKSNNPDLEVHLIGLVANKVDTDVYTDYYGRGYYRRSFGYGIPSTRVDVTEYKEGTLIIDLVDAEKGQLVWQGIGTARMNEDPKGRAERVNKAVMQILREYPPSK